MATDLLDAKLILYQKGFDSRSDHLLGPFGSSRSYTLLKGLPEGLLTLASGLMRVAMRIAVA